MIQKPRAVEKILNVHLKKISIGNKTYYFYVLVGEAHVYAQI